VLNFALTTFASWLEGRLRRSKKSTGATVALEDATGINPAQVGSGFGTGGGDSI
jgi:glutamate transport system permease protein